jgi:hypothetical protein
LDALDNISGDTRTAGRPAVSSLAATLQRQGERDDSDLTAMERVRSDFHSDLIGDSIADD